eukprot:scaffold9451_cov25-Prasinocladus_malaysianus.AAC.1
MHHSWMDGAVDNSDSQPNEKSDVCSAADCEFRLREDSIRCRNTHRGYGPLLITTSTQSV